MKNIKSKYANLPDRYYGGDSASYITPARFPEIQIRKDTEFVVWEWCAGSASVSAAAKEKEVPHLPPVDFRYGWDIGREADQVTLLIGLLENIVRELFASPNCAPWGNHTRGLQAAVLDAKRREEDEPLKFLAICCFLQ